MRTMSAVVKKGQVVTDEPLNLPDGTVVAVLAVDPGDHMDDDERAKLYASIRRGKADIEAGRVRDARAVVSELMAKHRTKR